MLQISAPESKHYLINGFSPGIFTLYVSTLMYGHFLPFPLTFLLLFPTYDK
jgi:hypothetical protein